MLPLRLLSLLLLSSSLCDAGGTCPPTLNLLILDSPVVITEYGKNTLVNCTMEEEEDLKEMTLVLGNDTAESSGYESFVFINTKLTDWNAKGECKIKLNESVECSQEIEVIVYKTPEVFLSVNLKEKANYKLQCDVFNAAPVQNLTIKWYKNDEQIHAKSFSETIRTPVNESSMLEVSVSREANDAQFRCEAQLELGPSGPLLPVVSQTHTLSALYPPEFMSNHSGSITVPKGDNISLSCEADGIPSPEYQWTVDDGQGILDNSSKLSIIKVNRSATYNCTATNELGSITLSVNVHVSEVTTTAAAAATPRPLTPVQQAETPKVFLSVNLKEKANYKLQCDVFNAAPVQNLTIKWYKNDEQIHAKSFSETIRTPVNESSMLEVSVSREANDAQFRCEAQLELGPSGPLLPVVSQTHTLSALYPPEFMSNHSGSITVPKGDNISLSCEADGIPSPEYQWTVDDGQGILDNSSKLSIIKVNRSATYNCTATNELGSITLSVNVHVSEVTTTAAAAATPRPLTPVQQVCDLTTTPPEVVVKFGDPVQINCSTSRADVDVLGWESSVGGNKTPDFVSVSAESHRPITDGSKCELRCDIYNVAPVHGLTVKWYKDNKTVFTGNLSSSDVTPHNLSSSLFATFDKSDNGSLFRCEVELQLGSKGPEFVPSAVSEPYTAVVHYRPFIKDCPRNFTAEENKFSVNDLSCTTDGNPPPDVKWYLNGEQVNTNKTLSWTDSGVYTAKFTNSEGNISTSVFITVEYSPSLTCEMHYEVKVNEKPKTLCEPKGLPTPNIVWFKNGKETILPERWSKNNSGNYSLKAQNKHGGAEHKFYLDVLYAPEFKEKNTSKYLIPGGNVTFGCRAEGNPSPEIKWSFRRADNLKETTEGRQKIITITGATSTNAGFYICAATNKVGTVTRTVTLAERDKTSGSFIWLVILLVILIVLGLLFLFFCYRKKKCGQYTFVSSTDRSSIPMTANSAAGKTSADINNSL
ncbi:intercellular adhesion molecule 5 isoform X2 [Kryptolebias marmoratus]|uniref:intercellular adhesion molecule 5 isoform X2 n=1 Tax=Kryptolebias marmoratus TaxID=37003 RepID=UPI0018ACE31C|nr:intercellular adhesion molecule 5 isoform X2 [Kryptolebias marmoratus]